jgi:hypothetical protein
VRYVLYIYIYDISRLMVKLLFPLWLPVRYSFMHACMMALMIGKNLDFLPNFVVFNVFASVEFYLLENVCI